MSVPEYTPGEWFGVVAGDMAVLLHPETPEPVVLAVWSTLRAREGLSRPLEALLVDGISGLHAFAAARVAGGVHTALRGDVTIVTTRDGERHQRTAPQVVLWTEDSDDAAERVELRAPGASTAGALPIIEGVVRASSIVLDGTSEAEDVAVPRTAAPRTAAPVGPVGPVAPARPTRPVRRRDREAELPPRPTPPTPAPVSTPVPASAAATEVLPAIPTPKPEPAPEPAPGTGLPPVDGPRSWPAVAPSPQPAPTPAPATPVATAPAPALPGPASDDDHDGMTILSGELASIRQNLPSWAVSDSGQWPSTTSTGSTPTASAGSSTGGTAAVPLTPPAPAPDSFPRVALSTGVVVPVDGVLLIGRAPQAARAAEGVRTRLVAVPSPTQDISRTHAEIRVESDRVLVTDLFSTNGVSVSSGGLPPRKIPAGEPVAVRPGELVDLGDGITFTVEPPA